MVSEALTSTRHRAISNHHADLTVVIFRDTGVMLQSLNNVRRRSGGRPPICFFVIGGFAFSRRWCAMWCRQPVNENSVKCKTEDVRGNHHSIFWEVMIIHERLYDKMYFNISSAICRWVVTFVDSYDIRRSYTKPDQYGRWISDNVTLGNGAHNPLTNWKHVWGL